MTAGLDNPEMASSGVKNPKPNRILRMSNAVISKLKVSVTKRINANPMMARTNAISNVIIYYFDSLRPEPKIKFGLHQFVPDRDILPHI